MVAEIFLKNIDRLIEQKNMSRNSFAESIGVHQSTISSWHTRKTIPSGEVLDRIAKFFEVEPSELFIRDMVELIESSVQNKSKLPFDDNYLLALGFDLIKNDYVMPLGRVLPGIPYIILDQLKALKLTEDNDKAVLIIALFLQYFTQEKGLKTFFDEEYSGEQEDDKDEIKLRKKQLLKIAINIAASKKDKGTATLLDKLRHLNDVELKLIESSVDAIIEQKKIKSNEKKSV